MTNHMRRAILLNLRRAHRSFLGARSAKDIAATDNLALDAVADELREMRIDGLVVNSRQANIVEALSAPGTLLRFGYGAGATVCHRESSAHAVTVRFALPGTSLQRDAMPLVRAGVLRVPAGMVATNGAWLELA